MNDYHAMGSAHDRAGSIDNPGTISNPFAVVVGICGHGLAIVRALHAGGVPIIALESNQRLPGLQTRLARVEMIADINGPGLIDSLLQLCDRINGAGMPVLFLTNDKMVRTVGEAWDRLEGAYHLSWAHSRRTMLPLLEKGTLAARCVTQALDYPATYFLTSTSDAGRAIEAIGFPIFVKPSRPLARFKTAQPGSVAELEALTRACESDLPFLVQRFIPGGDTSIYFSAVYLEHGKVITRFDGHKLRSRPLGHTTVAEACLDQEVFNQTCRFFDGLDLSGPVSLELKRDREGVLWVIEPTVGRTDFWIDLCTANGVNFPIIEYQHQISRPFRTSIQQNRAVWFNEERDPLGRLWFFIHKGLRLKGRHATFLYFHRSDIRPAVVFIKAVFAAAFRSVRTRWHSIKGAGAHLGTVECFEPSDDLPVDIQQFFNQAEVHDVEFGLTWFQNLVKTVYPEDQGIRIYVLRENGLPVAALPVRVIKKRLGQRVESLSNYYTALYAPVAAPELTASGLAELITAICKAHAPVGSFQFAPMDPQSAGYGTLMEALRLAGLLPFQFFCFGNWFLRVQDNWPAYFMSRPGILRSTINRMSKKFARVGGTLEIMNDTAELKRGLQAYASVYAASWKTAEPFVDFMPGLMHSFARQGQLRLGVAWLQDEPIAAQIWIVANGKANIYKLAYHEQYKAFSPGTLLTAMLMRHVMEQDGVEEVDYLIGDDPYKKAWMKHRRERWGIVGYNPKAIRGILGLGSEVLSRSLKPVILFVKTLVHKAWTRCCGCLNQSRSQVR